MSLHTKFNCIFWVNFINFHQILKTHIYHHGIMGDKNILPGLLPVTQIEF